MPDESEFGEEAEFGVTGGGLGNGYAGWKGHVCLCVIVWRKFRE
jgi:hypothetical protein